MSGEPRPPFGKAGVTPPATPPAGVSDPVSSAVDPSMEDILASIRRILNEEDGAGGAAQGGETEPGAEDALDLSEDMMVADPAPAASQPPPQPMAAPPPAPPPLPVAQVPPPPSMPEPAPVPAPPPAADGLLAPAAAAAATASLGALLRTVAAERSSAVTRGGPTIEDVVREAIRPMLKEWLDQHLPPLVERLVRAEIERVVGRALS